jgi:hypothetical protein
VQQLFKKRFMDINALLQTFDTRLAVTEREALQKKLEEYINYLIHHDFERLVQLLYTIDVDEKKLKTLLQQHPDTDAAAIISDLMIQRQLQKVQLRQQFKTTPGKDDEERW